MREGGRREGRRAHGNGGRREVGRRKKRGEVHSYGGIEEHRKGY